MPVGPQAKAWSAQRLVVGHEVGHEAVVAERAVVGRHDVLDLVGQQVRRIDLARAGRPEQQRHLATVADRLVGEHPDAGHAQAAGDEQQVAAARIDLERPAERAEQVDGVAWTQPGEPLGPPADDPEVDRDDAGDRVGGVERERPAQDHPGVVPGPDVDELAGPRPVREVGRVVRLEPLAGQDLAALDELGRGEPHGHAVGRPSAPSSASSASASASSVRPRRPARRRPRRRRPPPRLVGGRRVDVVPRRARAPPPGRPRPARRPGRRRRRSGRRTRRAPPDRRASATRRRPPRARPRPGTRRSR